jgi:uncharacterized protein (TIGR04255 family)
VPLFDLPPPPAYRLGNAPLVQALAQVRYPLVASFETLAGVAPLQAMLEDTFPYMEQENVQEIAFLVGPAGQAGGSSAESVNWKFTNDSGLLLTIAAGSASLTAAENYTGVEDFAMVFAQLLSALKAARVQRCDRIGVRYLSIAAGLPGDASAWRRWFNPELIGWVGTAVVPSDSLTMAISQVQLSHPATGDLAGSPADIQTVVRHGAVPTGTSVPGLPPVTISEASYLLDIDVFVAATQRFDPDMLASQFRQFHSQIDRFFFWSLSDEGRKHFELHLLKD